VNTTELIAALQSEVRIALHLASKVDAADLDYRPSPPQRSVLELVRYISMMGPALVGYALAEPPDIAIWTAAETSAATRDFAQSVGALRAQSAEYASLLQHVPAAALRSTLVDFDGNTTSRFAFIVNLVLCGCAAYRMQLFLYLKACGHGTLDSMNLWSGIDAPIT